MTTTNLLPPAVHDALLDAAAILLPVRCAGCAAPDRAVCDRCSLALEAHPSRTELGSLGVWAALDYEGVARAVLLAYKERGRTDAAPALAAALRPAVVAAQREHAAVTAATAATAETADPRPSARGSALLPVLIPSTRQAWRTRGYHPTGLVLARSRILVPPLWHALRLTRQTADQAGMSGAARAANREASMVASPRLRGRACLLVDDIVTTGATLLEAAKAIRSAGGTVAGAAAIARTPLRSG
ncbi:phosphoribosyltransferase family protein [Leifsonia sp. NPDC080035]|uniref:Phosphoribosyltransferase family protein n=1 Tax=Leifsonia sp. NPDC080035 TaxID=3143936 RepID=A0AAU7G875_9MICO